MSGDTGGVDDSTLIGHIRTLMVESSRFVHAFGDSHALHRSDLAALVAIMDAATSGHPLSQGELANELQLSASATTSVLDRLQALGHVERRRDDRDRRRVVLHIRPSAQKLGHELFSPLGAAYARAWAQFDEAERRTIERFLDVTVEATVRTRHQRPRED
ncbi:MarR family winged helix-turn-helix transcriptional regulator [Saccharomonospora azurea]|uniref:MarR family winged helix-turn-helix transcriptional regulator n=1 Tax=Saccharomonospora azurea TaxID=40988 RepID=UPI00024009B9|nr:MarR family transcriptional regulator [Saccharomonospora azurea]EHK89206.1 transcriptional regulator [Saccharomonospora azurea SZMC 14600]